MQAPSLDLQKPVDHEDEFLPMTSSNVNIEEDDLEEEDNIGKLFFV